VAGPAIVVGMTHVTGDITVEDLQASGVSGQRLTVGSHTLTDTWDAHHALLGAGVLILENADLHAVPPGDYELVCLPAKLVDADGSFTRAILIRRDES
jgi:kynurenine formamidase